MNECNDTSIVNEVRSENILELWALPELCNKNFFIPDYQRGYRWGTRQVEQLLDDLCAYFDRGKGQFYCLQPIVVKEITKDEDKNKYGLISKTDNNRWYEVIDGQQRLTTIRIIFTCRRRQQGQSLLQRPRARTFRSPSRVRAWQKFGQGQYRQKP